MNKKKLDFDVKRYLVAEVLYPDHVVPLHVGEWTSLSPVFGTQNRKYPKENLNLHVFGQGDYCNFLDV